MRACSVAGAYTQAWRGSVYAIFEEEKGKFEKSVYERRTEIRHLGAWRVYVIFKIAKGFLYRGVYTVGRGSVYAIFEEEKGKFEKSVYRRRTEIRHY